MRSVRNRYKSLLLVVFNLLILSSLITAQNALAPQGTDAKEEFERQAKQYSKLREQLEKNLPKLPKEATAEQIEAHKTNFQKLVLNARQGMGQGSIFTPAAAEYIRNVVKIEFEGADRANLRDMVQEADTSGIPLRINYPYPEAKEQTEMPPNLLLSLPKLPKQLRYRFVGTNLLLVDRENGLIVDYMTNAVPPVTPVDKILQKVEANTEKMNVDTSGPTVAPPVVPPTATSNSLPLTLPLREGSVRFLAIGDTGRGNKEQHDLAKLMVDYRKIFPYEFVLMTGDNIYGSDKAESLKSKFEDVYKTLLNDGVKFYASLGNHDGSNQRFYDFFNMNGEEYYVVKKGDVSFYALNSNYMDERQIKWMENQFSGDKNKWKVAFFHHPPYSSGEMHGSSKKIREIVEPLFIKYKINVVLNGHEHFYERIKPQNGVYYFITGAGGKIREGDIKKNSPLTEKGFDTDLSFMLIEIDKDEMHFQVVSKAGETVDSGIIKNSN